MNKNNNQLIADQLQTLAAAMPAMEDADLLPAILDSCAILLAEVAHRHKPLDWMDPVERSELTGAYTVISEQVTQFAAEARSQLGIDSLPAEDPMLTLAAEAERARQLEIDRKAAQVQLDALKAENHRQQQELNAQSQELADLRSFQSGLERELQACSDDVIARQTEANEALLITVTEQRAKLKSLRDEAAAKETDLARIRQDIAAIEGKIENIPAENKALLSDFDAKTQHLARLEQAQIDCSVEKQLALEARIKELTPIVEELEAATRKLSAHCRQLEDARTDLNRQNQTLQTTIVQRIQDSMAELQQLLTEHQSTLQEVKRQADALHKNLTACQTLRAEYAEWFDASRTPLDAMLAEVDRAEHQKLRDTLDLAQCDQIRQLYAQVRDGLQRLDKVITACAEAARIDQRNLERRVVAK